MPQKQIIQAAFDQGHQPAFICDRESVIVAVNKAAASLLRREQSQLTGRTCQEIFRCASCERGCSLVTALRVPGLASEHALRIATQSGRDHMACVQASTLTDDGGRMEAVLVVFMRAGGACDRQASGIVAESKVMRTVLDFARRVAASEATTVLLQGESGTGKEVIARLLHDASQRSAQPFVAINCAAMPETLLESELFGYEKGAFTDARVQKKGLFELAGGGTLFLDEIGELPVKLQAKLLRVLDDQSFRRLGGLREIHYDFRIVAATNRDLPLAVAQGLFRQDLFYRLNVIQVKIPPLRERPEDILPLARHFVEMLSRRFRRNAPGFADETAGLLLGFDWPGNVRELRNAMEHSLLLEDSNFLTPGSLPAHLQANGGRMAQPSAWVSLKESEESLIAIALVQTNGNQTRAARLLGISRDALRFRLKKREKAVMFAVAAQRPGAS